MICSSFLDIFLPTVALIPSQIAYDYGWPFFFSLAIMRTVPFSSQSLPLKWLIETLDEWCISVIHQNRFPWYAYCGQVKLLLLFLLRLIDIKLWWCVSSANYFFSQSYFSRFVYQYWSLSLIISCECLVFFVCSFTTLPIAEWHQRIVSYTWFVLPLILSITLNNWCEKYVRELI